MAVRAENCGTGDLSRSGKVEQEPYCKSEWLALGMFVDSRYPWSGRSWDLSFLTVLAPSGKYDEQRRRKHRKVLDKAAAMVRFVRWWLPERDLVIVSDGAYTSTVFAAYLQRFKPPMTLVSRFCLDAERALGLGVDFGQ